MKEALKKNWKPVTAFALALSAVGALAYYVNFIYIPGKERARAAELAAAQAQAAPEPPKDYHFTIDTSNPASISKTTPGTNTVDDSIKVTTDADGNVTVDRTWDADPDELDTTTAAPGTPTANIGSGSGKITGTDGAYHGEQPSTTPSTGGSSGTDSTKPSTGDTTTKPSTGDKTTTPSDDSSTTTPSDSSTKPSTPSTPSTPGSSTPQMGDTRVVNGKEQMYVEGFGWTDVGDGGQTDYIEMPEGDFGGADGLGAQVGEMG